LKQWNKSKEKAVRLSPFACAPNVRQILVWNYKKFRSNLKKIIQIPFGIWIIGTP